MRRSTFVLPVVAAAALAAPAAASNPQVAGLQVALRAYGLYLGPIDAQGGPATAAAIRAFQKRRHLPVDGVAGVKTRAALGPLGRPLFGRRTIKKGAFGWDVSVLQFLLTRRGLYAGPLDGYVGPETVTAIRRYQRQMHLAVDGVAGKATTAALVLQQHVPVPPRPDAAPAPRRIYVVKSGDNLTVLARRFGVTLHGLARANGLNPARPLLIGTKLRLPTRSSRATTRSVAAVASTAATIRDALGEWAQRYGVDPSLARALSWMESGFQEHVVSKVGAWGPMQLLPSTWDFVEDNLLHARVEKTAVGNVQVGVAYLKHLLDNFAGDESLALAAWYQGERAVREHGVYNQSKQFVANVLALKERM